MVWLAVLCRPRVVGLVGGVLDGAPSCVLIAVACVLDQLLLCLFEALGRDLPGLDPRPLGLGHRAVGRLGL